MLSVLKYEWRRLVGCVYTVVSVSVLALLSGILCTVLHLSLASANTAYSLRILALPMVLLITLPVLLVRSRESANSRVFLHALPLSRTALFAGRLLADWGLLLISSAVLLILPLLLSIFGEINFAEAYLSLGAYLLLGIFFLTLTEVIHVLFGKLWLRLCVLYGGVALSFAVYCLLPALELPHAPEAVLSAINPFCGFEELTHGRLSVSALLTLLVFLAAALYVLYMATVSRRTSPIRVAVTLCIAVVLSLGGILIPFSLDLTGDETFVISGITKDALKALDKDVKIHYLVEGGKTATDESLYGFLQKYAAESEHIQITIVDTARESAFYQGYRKSSPPGHSLIVESDLRYYVIDSSDFYHYYNSELNQNFSAGYYNMCLAAYEYYVKNGNYGNYDSTAAKYGSTLYYSTGTTAYFDGDALLCNAIRYVTDDAVPTLYFYGNEKNSADEQMLSFLSSSGYFIRELKGLSVIPEDCALLYLYSPEQDLTADESVALQAYLDKGGDMFLATSCASLELPRLLSILNTYGMRLLDDNNIVCELLSAEGEYAENFYAHVTSSADATGSFDERFVLMVPHAIALQQTENVKQTSWIYTSKNACIKRAASDPDPTTAEQYTCGAIAEKGNSRILWISSALSFDLQAYVYSGGNNYQLLLSGLDWATETEYTHITVPSSTIKSSILGITSGEISLWGIVIAVIIPLCTALPLTIRLYARRKR